MAASFASSSFGGYGKKKFEEVPLKVDEVAPFVPVLLPLPTAAEEMGAFAHRSSPIQEEDDESMLFPLPSPRRSTPSPTPSSTHSLSNSRSSSRTPSPLPSPSHLSPSYSPSHSPSHSPLPPHSPLHSPLPSHPHPHSQSPLLSHPSPLQAFKRSSPRLSPRASPRASPAGSQESLLRASLSRKVSPGGWLKPLEDERGAKEREEKTKEKEKEEVKEREDKKEERVNGKERGKENGKEEVVFIRTPASPEEEKEKALPDLPKREDVQVELKTRNGHGKSVSDGPRGFGTGPTVPLKTWPEAEKEMTSPKLLPTSPKLTSTSPPLSAINRRRSASASQSPPTTISSSSSPNSSSPRIPGRRKLSLSQSFAAPFLKAGGAIRDVGADVLKGVSGMGGMGGMSGMGGVPGGVGGG